MHKLRTLAVVLPLCLAGHVARAQDFGWRDASGQPVPPSESMKSMQDFGGSLLITTDEDWREKWNTPPDDKPNFHRADVIPHGKRIFVLTFFANPKLDDSGNARVRCDIQVTSPIGKVALSQKDMVCFEGAIAGSLTNMYLSAPVIAFSGDPGDPPGQWLVDVSLRDVNRGVTLSLRSGFQLK